MRCFRRRSTSLTLARNGFVCLSTRGDVSTNLISVTTVFTSPRAILNDVLDEDDFIKTTRPYDLFEIFYNPRVILIYAATSIVPDLASRIITSRSS